MKLEELVEGYAGETVFIKGLSTDSRTIQPGFLFIALPSLGGKNPHPFIQQALDKGACAVITTAEIRSAHKSAEVPFIVVDNPRYALSRLAARFYNRKPEQLAAVTGTSGKSSVVDFVRQFWEAAGHKAACIGTLGVTGPQGLNLQEGALTSPDALTLHQTLGHLQAEGYTHAALEASSHGLDQYRLHNLPFKAAAFTNLSQDHLDYHGTLEVYKQAKLTLFSHVLPQDGTAVLNADSAVFEELQDICARRSIPTIAYGYKGKEIKLLAAEPHPQGQRLILRLYGEVHALLFPLWGEFQALNALCAAGLTIATGVPLPAIVDHFPRLKGVPGRLQWVGDTVKGAKVFVDYAHKPDALEQVLKTLRPLVGHQLKVIFGCGGDRDKLKRPLMGKIAAEYADDVIVTDDNPRSEDPARIRSEILQSSPGAKEISPRDEAIATGVKSLEAGDILVVAGKGHEKGQTIGQVTYPFDDAEAVQYYLNEDQK